MAKREVLIIIAFASLVYCSESEESEQKKRGVGKATALNSIPTGAQKQEYSYSGYSQHSQSPSSQYQNQVSSSFYPNQASSQYYSASNPSTDTPSTYSGQQHASPPSTSQFVPLSFVPNPGYQAKYQAVSSKSPNVQLAIVPQSNTYPSQSIVPYHQFAQSIFASNNANQAQPQQGPAVHSIPQFNIPSNYQHLQIGNPYLNQPSTMVLLAQPNPSVYNNLLYPNPIQGLYNYYPSNSQTKYSAYPSSTQAEYQTVPKEEVQAQINSQNADYSSASDSNSSYKNSYSSRNSFGKLQ